MIQGLKRSARFLFYLTMAYSILAGCVAPLQPTETSHSLTGQSPTVIPSTAIMDCLENETDFSDQIQNILQQPQDFIGKTITLIGYYRGWDLLQEALGPSPVTRSDWVLRDRCGAIYVLARDGMNLGLNPGDKSSTVKVVMVKGIVRMAANGQPYIEPQDVKLLR